MTLWKRLVIMSALGGMAFAVTLTCLWMGLKWYRSRPAPWDARSLAVTWSEALGAIDMNPKTRAVEDAGFVLEFVIENRSDRDITLPRNITVMKRDAATKALEYLSYPTELYRDHFLPARERVKISLWLQGRDCRDTPLQRCYERHLGENDAIVLLHRSARLSAELPRPRLKER